METVRFSPKGCRRGAFVLFECDKERVQTRVAASCGDRFDLLVRRGEQADGMIDSSLDEFHAGCGAEVRRKGEVEAALRHAGSSGDVTNSEWFGKMSHDEAQRF